MRGKSIKYVYSEDLINISDQNPAVKCRASMVHELIKSYKLLRKMEITSSKPSDYVDLRLFHTEEYVKLLECVSSMEDGEEYDLEEYGMGYDCPTWKGVYEYALAIAGSTITACEELCNGADIAINWCGGWHHAHKDKAAGYCYVNDIVLGLLVLRKRFDRVLYIDLDVHHGDGVQNAFESSKSVFTLSFHKMEAGFFPGTGGSTECGFGAAKAYSANCPYSAGISKENFQKYFQSIAPFIIDQYQPKAIVVQCGGDVIAGDPLGDTNLIPEDLGDCISMLLARNIPTLLLGGGGYNFQNTSKYWTFLTALVCGSNLDDDIPDENEFFLKYGPDYSLTINRKLIPDENTEESIERNVQIVKDIITQR